MNKENQSQKEIVQELIDREIIVDILPTKEAFFEELEKRSLKFYWGFDPTSTALHLSHGKNILLLETFRKLGHHVNVLFGDFTARIGDPTDKGATRTALTEEEVNENVKQWLEQVRPLISLDDSENPAHVVYNSEWLGKMDFADVLDLSSHFTVQQMLERDMFKKRLQDNKPIHVHEFMYPLMQGYDSVAQDIDVECCGTDQTFNALAGRTLMKKMKDKEKFVITVNLMEDPVTGELMSKSRGNGVFLNASANEMYAQIMAQNDSMLLPLFINWTTLTVEEIKALDFDQNPFENKHDIATRITGRFHGEEAAQEARKAWEATFSQAGFPEDAEIVQIHPGVQLHEVLIENGLAASKTEFRRFLENKSLKEFVAGDFVVIEEDLAVDRDMKVKVGKKRFVEVEVKVK